MEFHPEISRKFTAMGARIRLGELEPTRWMTLDDNAAFRLNIVSDRRGPYFDFKVNPRKVTRLFTLDVRPRQRHLVLFCSEHFQDEKGKWLDRDHRVLCGHDEREWFCAAIPEKKRVTTVAQAMDALMPDIARDSLVRHKVKGRDRFKRRNRGYKRQGEWFFIPDPKFQPRDNVFHGNEALQRGVGKPHMTEYLVRSGGRVVYVGVWGRAVINEREFQHRMRNPHLTKNESWRPMVENPIVHVRGWVKHPDHKTIILRGWHRVEPNTEESQVGGNRTITFID